MVYRSAVLGVHEYQFSVLLKQHCSITTGCEVELLQVVPGGAALPLLLPRGLLLQDLQAAGCRWAR